MLITLSHSPFHCDINALARLLVTGDDLLLLQDGVIAALADTAAMQTLKQTGATLYVLDVDVVARGLCAQISSDVVTVNYTDFVELTVKNPRQMAW